MSCSSFQREGYVKNTVTNGTNSLNYVFNYTDHLGNVRVSYQKNAANALEILEENNYYPFGLKHEGYNTDNNQPNYKYKYNGKELQDETIGGLALNWYDMEARNYMPDIGRWGVIDELAENFDDSSPYNFANNNPILFSDPSGLAPEGGSSSNYFESTFVDQGGKVVEHRDDGDDNVYLVGNNWKPGGSKSGLSVIGHEAPGETYRKGDKVLMDFNGYANVQRMATGAATPIGGAFDIFGVWEAFYTELFNEIGGDSPESALAFAVVTRGKAKTSTSVRAVIGLLKSGKLHKHHVLSQQFRKWFAGRGIKNIDDYTIQMSAKNHLKTLHGQGKWNQQWADFIKANPNATPSQIFYQAESMLKRYGLEHSRYVPYK